MTMEVRCSECWRSPAHGSHGVPQWRAAPLWQHAAVVKIDADTTWSPFDVALPPALPPAIEARTIACRYEVVMRRRGRRWPGETAARTPLLPEETAAVWAER